MEGMKDQDHGRVVTRQGFFNRHYFDTTSQGVLGGYLNWRDVLKRGQGRMALRGVFLYISGKVFMSTCLIRETMALRIVIDSLFERFNLPLLYFTLLLD